jgi:hypothetical protein
MTFLAEQAKNAQATLHQYDATSIKTNEKWLGRCKVG